MTTRDPLNEARSELLTSLTARGITTMEAMVAEIAAQQVAAPIKISSPPQEDAFFEQMTLPGDPALVNKITHPAPMTPVVLDGKRVDPESLTQYNGQPLDYVLTTPENEEPTLVVFTDRKVLPAHLRGLLQGRQKPASSPIADSLRTAGITLLSNPRTIPCPPCMPGVWIHEHIHFGGDVIRFADHEGHDNLTRFTRGRTGLFAGSWNDAISSISCVASHCFATDHIHWGGSRLFLGPYQSVADLRQIGWNDRISAIWNTGWF